MAELGFDVRGRVGAPAVVLVPSLGTSRSMWDATAEVLARAYRVVSVDLVGHGDSAVPEGPYSLAQLSRAVLDVLDDLGVARAHLAGVSIGGMIGMWLAAHAPDRVDRMVLVCTAAYLPNHDSYRERAAVVRAHGTASIADAVVARWFTPAYRVAHPQVVAGFAATLAAAPDEGYAACCEAIAVMDLRADLRAISAPTLVLSGADDAAIPPDLGAETARAMPDATFRLIADAAHLANVERDAQVTALIEAFLAGDDSMAAGSSRDGEPVTGNAAGCESTAGEHGEHL